eukprot:PhM_4_TR3817/c0_g1_i1/m.91987
MNVLKRMRQGLRPPNPLQQSLERLQPVPLKYNITVSRWHTDCRAPINVVLIHGLFSNGLTCWSSVMREMCALPSTGVVPVVPMHMHAVDLRGHGESPHSQSFDLSLCARDVVDFIQKRSSAYQEAAIVLGVGFGGQVALTTAMAYPNLVRGVVTINADVSSPVGAAEHPLLSAIGSNVDNWQAVVAGQNNLRALNDALVSRIPNAGEREALLSNVRNEYSKEEGANRLSWKYDLPALCEAAKAGVTHNVVPADLKLPACDVPVLMLHDAACAPSPDTAASRASFTNLTIEPMDNLGGAGGYNLTRVPRAHDVLVKSLSHLGVLGNVEPVEVNTEEMI